MVHGRWTKSSNERRTAGAAALGKKPAIRGGVTKKEQCQSCADGTEFDARVAFERLAKDQQALAELIARSMLRDRQRGADPSNALAAPQVSLEELELVERIMGGVPTAASEYPECCLIGKRSLNGALRWFCTGTLIHPRVVVTAAHCLEDGLLPNRVAFGALDKDDLSEAEICSVKRRVVHPLYTSTGRHDIALLILSKDAKTKPVARASTADLIASMKTTLVGFGTTDANATRGFGVQRKVTVNLRSLRISKEQDLDEDEEKFGFESDYELVAGADGFDSCKGDSGGPAYLEGNGVRKLAGVTSRGVPSDSLCGDGGIYTRIDEHKSFIDEVMRDNNIDL